MYLSSACVKAGSEVTQSVDVEAGAVTELVASDREVIGEIADLALGADGRLYAADSRNNRILMIDTAAGSATTLGREGDGPMEFRGPTAVSERQDTLQIYDAGNSRMVLISKSDQRVVMYPAETDAYASSSTIDARGSVLTATGGFHDGLAVLLDNHGKKVRGFGVAVPLPPGFTPGDMRADLQHGRLPALFQNNVVAARSADGSVYLAMKASPVVLRYASTGDLEWADTLSEPGDEQLRQEYIQLNLDEPNVRRFYPPQFIADIQTSTADLWILGSPLRKHITVWRLKQKDGTVERCYRIQALNGVTAFAIDPSGHRAYLVDNDRGRILKVALPH